MTDWQEQKAPKQLRNFPSRNEYIFLPVYFLVGLNMLFLFKIVDGTNKKGYIGRKIIDMGKFGDYIRFDWAMKQMLRDKANLGILEGYAEGRAEGLSEGRNEQNKLNARKMMEAGINPEIIKQVTGLELRILPLQKDMPVYFPKEADITPGESLDSLSLRVN